MAIRANCYQLDFFKCGSAASADAIDSSKRGHCLRAMRMSRFCSRLVTPPPYELPPENWISNLASQTP